MKVVLAIGLLFSFTTNADFDESVYNNLSACQKQDFLWKKIQETKHKSLPELSKVGLKQFMGMIGQGVKKKATRYQDFSPKKWPKHIHKRGSMVKAKFVPAEGSKATGLYTGFDCSLIRISITSKPDKSRGFAPGLGWKILRDGQKPSSNVSLLYTLSGQGYDYNIFANFLSNIVPKGKGFKEKAVHYLFKKVSRHPETLMVKEFAGMNVKGEKVDSPEGPFQIFLVPADNLRNKFSSEKHDFREDLATLESGIVLYKVYGLSKYSQKDYKKYKVSDIEGRLKESEYLGDIVTTSKFVASEFGDSGIFFRHEVINRKN